MQLKDFYGLAGELGRTTITIVAITIGGFLSISLVTLVIVGIITVICCFVVHSRQKRNHQSDRNAYELTSNNAYQAWKDQGFTNLASANNSSPVVYDYISNGSELEEPRMPQ